MSLRHSLVVLLASCALLPSGGIAQSEPRIDTNGIPYSVIEAAPVLGKVLAYNAAYALVVAELRAEATQQVAPGTRVALRRDGVLVAFGYVETIENQVIATLHLLDHRPGGATITIPAVGDHLIRTPRQSRFAR